MGFNDRLIFAQPEPGGVHVERQALAGTVCPECGGEKIERYPIGHYKGPRMVTKCQACFHTLAVERPALEDNWPPFRAATFDWGPSPAEAVGGERRRAGAPGGADR